MKIYFYLCPIFFLCWGTSLKGQISAETETNLQLNTIDTIQAGDNVMIDKNGQLHFTTNGQSKQIESKNELSLSSKYLNYGVGYEGAFYYKHNNRVYLGGLVRAVTGSQTVDWFDLVGTLPKGYRPEKIVYVQATQNGNSIRSPT